MALDLDSILGCGDDNGDDNEDLSSVPHRTVDDILDDSDPSSSPSSSSSSPSRGALSHLRGQVPPRGGDVSVLVVSDSEAVETLNSDKSETTLEDDVSSARRSTDVLLNRARRGESSASAAGGSFSLGGTGRRFSGGGGSIPPLFGTVRSSSSKPGAALAAAAAASRSAPTPHAAAIKLRRAGSSNLQKALLSEESSADGSELGLSADASSGIGLNAVNNDGVAEDNEKMEPLQSVDVGRVAEVGNEGSQDTQAAVGECESRAGDSDKAMFGSSVVLEQRSSMNVEEDLNEAVDAAVSVISDELVQCSEKDVFNMNDGSSSSLEVADNTKQGSTSLHGSREVIHVEEDSAMAKQGDWDKVILVSNDGKVGLAGNEDSPGSEVTERMEDILERVDNKKMEKKSRPPMKPLEAAEELEKKQASTGLHWEEGAAAQPMRLEGVRRGSTVLGYFNIDGENTISRTISSQAFRCDHGSPQVVAVHANFIAVGMSRGSVIIAPSRYSAYIADNMDAKMLILGPQADRSHTSVTSICFNQQGDLLLAGYGDGHITLWDVQRTAVAKVITGEHSVPVVHTFFLMQDSQVTRQFKAVTGDSKGLVLLHAFSVLPLLNMYSITTQCIVDGQRTGMVLAASPLFSGEFRAVDMVSPQANNVISSSSLGVVIFVTHQTALVIRLTPTFEVYAQLSKPDGIREGSLPYTAWKCMVQSCGSSTENTSAEASEEVSLLAIAWDRKVQVAKLVKSELKIYGKWTLESAAIGVAWLDDQMLVVLTSTGQLCLYAKDGSVVHKTSISRDSPGGDDLIVYHTHFINVFGNPEKAYHNSVAVRGASIYIIGPSHLIVTRLLPWKERIQVLRRAGDWMGALSMAMTIYDGEALGVIDLPKTQNVVQEAIIPDLVELLLTYVDEVFSYISVAFCNQVGKMEQLEEPQIGSSSVLSEIKEQFTRVGGVAVEFCVHIKKTNILFDEIFPKFEVAQQRDTFLELLEPYILKDMLGSLPPEIMQALVEHYSNKGWLHRVEQCVLHMDIASLDFNQVVKLCREHGLYGALTYLFNRGLGDFKAPLEELLIVLQNGNREISAPIGYRMLVYLKYCFSGHAFPPGHGTIPPTRLPSLRAELVQFLLEDSNIKAGQSSSKISTMEGRSNLYYLLELDTEATLDVLRYAFGENEMSEPGLILHNSAENIEIDTESDSLNRNMVQDTVDVLVHILDKVISESDAESVASTKAWPSKKDTAHVFDFIAYYITCERVHVSKSMLSQILEYLTSESGQTIEISKKREKQVLALLEVVPETDWNESHVLHLCEKAKFYQVCGLIYSFRLQYLAALDSYMKDKDEPIHAFSFINSKLVQLSHSECVAFRSAVISRIPELVNLSREATFFMVIDHFAKESAQILAELQCHPKSLFFYLKTVIEAHLFGTLNFSCIRKEDVVDYPNGRRDQISGCSAYLERISDFPKMLRNNPINVNDEMIELYIELLCQYEHTSVLKFLQTFENYRVEHCLRLCQEYGIIDAAAFLLERVGDVGSALSLTLSGLNDIFIRLDAAVESVASGVGSRGYPGTEHFSLVSRIKEVNAIHDILNACIGLCQRNSRRLQLEESEFLWFRLLESFCVPLTNSNYDTVPEGGNDQGILPQSLGLSRKEDKDVGVVKWRISHSSRAAPFLKRLFSQFIKEIVEGMMGYIHLPTIMSKLLSENTDQEFGNFKLTILGMLATCGFEKRILDTAKSLIEADAFYTMSVLKKGASHGYAPRILLCCICGCLLIKKSSGYSVRVFSCGHSTHLHCEAEMNDTSRTYSLVCPVCAPTKKSQRSRSKSIIEAKGLVNMALSRSKHVQGTVLHSYEGESQENPYGHQQISRFEILNNLRKEQHLIQLDNVPHLRLSPPAVYHEKVKKGSSNFLIGERSHVPETVEKLNGNRQFRDSKARGSSIRFPLKSSIFGKEKGPKR